MFDHLRDDINSIIERDPAARNAWEVLTCYPGLQAIVMHRWANWCWRSGLPGLTWPGLTWPGLKWCGRFISYLARIITGIEIHPGATIGRRVFIDHGFGVVIGETAEVGDDCTIYQGVTLGGTSLHTGRKRHPTLGQGVIIGAGAKVLGSFTVGDYAKVGSNAVLLKAVPPQATAVGNPAHIIEKNSRQDADERTAHLFAAYGVTPNGDDPLSKALHGLINAAATQERQTERIIAAMNAAGIDCCKVPECDKIDSAKLNKLVD